MRVLGKIFSGICAVAFMCSMQAAPAKSSTAKKSSKPKLELELKGISEAKKLYKFLESNEGKIVELDIRLPHESFNLDRIFTHTNESVNKNGELVCVEKKNKIVEEGIKTINEYDTYPQCDNEHKYIIEHHFGKNALKDSMERQEMDEKWKKANSDIVISGDGDFTAFYDSEIIEEYRLNKGNIAFEDYQANGKSQFYSISVKGKDLRFGSFGLHGLFFVSPGGEDFQYLEISGAVCGYYEECEPNSHSLSLESIDIPKYKAIFEYLGK